MAGTSAKWYLWMAIVLIVIALIGVLGMEWLQANRLSLWLHVPLTALVLGLMGIGAGLAGAAYLEYRQRSLRDGEQAQ